MDDVRFQKVENQVALHARKLKEHERLHGECADKFLQQSKMNEATVDNIKALTDLVVATQQSVAAHEKNTAAAVNLTEKIENLASALGIIGAFAKWVLAVSAFFGMIYASIKGVSGDFVR